VGGHAVVLRPSGGEVGLMSGNVSLHGEESGLGGDVLLLQTRYHDRK
jgi:hypothetical protein